MSRGARRTQIVGIFNLPAVTAAAVPELEPPTINSDV